MPEGRCTCQTARGQSVVDYIIASVDLLLFTKSFQIGETSPLSDHRCVTATLQCKDNSSTSNMHTSKSKPTGRQIVLYKWKDEHKEQYVKNLNTLHVQHQLNNIRYSILCNNVISPNEHIEALNEVIRTSAAPSRIVFSCQRTNKSVHIAPLGTMRVVKYKDSNIINNATNSIRRMQKRTNNKEMKQDQNTETHAERNVT